MARVYVFLADGFEEVEALTVVDILRRAEVEVIMISVQDTMEIYGAHGIVVTADRVFDEVSFDEVDMLILPGGMPGTMNLAKHEGLVEKLVEFNEENKMLAAICAAPSVLGQNGILRGKKATCYPGFEDQLLEATVCQEAVVVDENIITSRGMGTAIPFALTLVSYLEGDDIASAIRTAIIYE